LLRRYGGVPVTLAATEVAGALQSGVINAMFATASTSGNTKLEPWKSGLVAGYTGYQGYADAAFIANPQAFASLGTETQALLTRAVEDASAWIAATRDAEEAVARDELRNAGVKIAEGTAEELVIARLKLAPYWGSWAVPRGRDAMDQLAIMRKTLER
jgi:TRAP-type C4-dicarboxylate transport system substrate-binding protein